MAARRAAISDVQATEKVRAALADAVPGTQVFFFTGGIVKRILNFGSAAPIDIEILGYDWTRRPSYAKQLAGKLRGARRRRGRRCSPTCRSRARRTAPELDVIVDREKAGVLGVSERTSPQTVLTSLLGQHAVQPIPFTDQKTGNEYFINVRMEDRFRTHVADLGECS